MRLPGAFCAGTAPGTTDPLRKFAGKDEKMQKDGNELFLKRFFKIYKKQKTPQNGAMQHFVIFLKEK